MKTAYQLCLVLLVVGISAATLSAQEKLAEGEYKLSQAAPGYPQKHWVLTARSSGGYLLRSEIHTPANGIPVFQLEELNDQLIPTSIGYELYLKDQAEPKVIVNCAFARDSITCGGKSEKGIAHPSKPFQYKGPFLFAVRDLSHFDFAWLMAGAMNMAHLTSGKASLRTIHLTGGAALELTDEINVAMLQAVMTSKQTFRAIRPERYTEWEFISDDDDVETVSFLSAEEVELNETKVPARHYSIKTSGETLHFWMADPGILLKIKARGKVEYVLANYRQYKKLIPQIKVDEAATLQKTH